MSPNDRARNDARHPEPAAERLLQIVGAMLHELHPSAPPRSLGLDDSIERDIGLDSLSRIELAARVERAFGIRLPDRLATSARTLRELFEAIATAEPGAAAAAPPMRRALLPEPVAGTPEKASTIVEAFRWHLERHPEREHIALLEGDDVRETLSYARLWTDATEVAQGLAAAGVGRGDAVAIMLPTGGAFFQSFLGAMLIGAMPVPMYPPTRWTEIEEHVRGRAAILANSLAKVLVTLPEAMFIGRLARAELPHLRAVVSVERLRAARSASAPPPFAHSDIAMLQYTSGSTGNPKGVVLSHDNLLANIRVMGRAAAVTSTDRFVSWLPLYHDMGLIGAWLATMYHAIPLALMPPTTFLARPSRWLWAIHRHRGTISAGPNFAYEIAASKIADEELAGLDLASWRLAFNGAEPVRAATLERFAARFSRHGFDRRALTPVYGLAECTLGLAFPQLQREPLVDRIDAQALARDGLARPAAGDSPAALEVVSCGAPLSGHEIRIVDDGERELPARSEGRVEFRGPSATAGYYRNPEGTAKLFRDGWLDTGDVGYIAAGELFLTSRVKDLIKRGGHNLHPYDLEAAAGDIPGIRRGCVAVFGTTDHASGTERVVVVAETSRTDAAERAALRQRIMALAAVHLNGPADEILLVPARTVLKTSSGKIRRAACRDLYEKGLLEAPRRAVWRQLAGLAVRAASARLRRTTATLIKGAYGVYAWLVLLVVSIAGTAALPFIAGLPARYRFAHGLARTLLRLLRIPLAVEGIERLPGGKAALIAVNHASYADAFVLMAVLSSPVRFAAKAEFARTPLFGYVLRRLGTYFVERFDATRGVEDTRELAAALRGDATVVMFPEGTFSRAPGLAAFRMGAFVASAQASVPVVPIVLRGTRSLLREHRWLPVRNPVQVSVLAPVVPTGRDWSAAVRLRDQVRGAMLPVCGEPDLAA
ncbi:MAG TPA: AMP-binding protein [Casimicrobiaceae bacterium]